MSTTTKRKSISYAKWGYIFIIPFFVVYITCSLIPLITTIYNSFFAIASDGGIDVINNGFIGFDNYARLFKPVAGELRILTYFTNTIIMWVMGAVPQFIFALILAVLFTSARLKIKGQTFFKTVIYMPNVIMAASFAILFFTLFSPVGPINQIYQACGGAEAIRFFENPWATRGIIAFINFLMWFGNTTILLMAGILGIDQSLFEAASIDGANSGQVFFKITLPLLMPILVYVAITSLIGGLQMFDVPQVIGDTVGDPQGSTKTMIMYLNQLVGTRQYGMAGAVSVVIFIITAILSIFVYKSLVTGDNMKKAKKIKGGK